MDLCISPCSGGRGLVFRTNLFNLSSVRTSWFERKYVKIPVCGDIVTGILRVILCIVVSTPADHGMPYVEIELETSDGVKIKAYLLVQRRHLAGASEELPEDGANLRDSEDEVPPKQCN